MMNCAIMQPMFIPWSGYFNLIVESDKFVFLDDVAYQKRSWQVRNRILLFNKDHMLSLAVEKCSQSTPINQVSLSVTERWKDKQLKMLQSCYKKANFADQVLTIVEEIYALEELNLSTFNISIVKLICNYLGIENKFYLSSQLNCEGQRSERLDNICQKLGAKEYLSPVGSKDYLKEDDFQNISGIALRFQQFSPAVYSQVNRTEFLSHLSILDVIANIGLVDTKRYCEGVYEN